MVRAMTCTRCKTEKERVLPVFTARPDGYTCMTPYSPESPDFNLAIPPQAERVCGDCLTDHEIMIGLSPAIEYVLGTLAKDAIHSDVAISLETAHSFFMVRNNGSNTRAVAIRALGL